MQNKRPAKIMDAIMADYKGISRSVNILLEGRGKSFPDWENWCFLPMVGWSAILAHHAKSFESLKTKSIKLQTLSSIGTWQYLQGIYKINPLLAKIFQDTPVNYQINSGTMIQLPEFSMYVDCEDLIKNRGKFYGFWVHLEFNVDTQSEELRFLLDYEARQEGYDLEVGDFSIQEALIRHNQSVLEEAIKNSNDQLDNLTTINSNLNLEIVEIFNPLINVILYLCKNPDITNNLSPNSKSCRLTPKKVITGKGIKVFPAQSPRWFDVGKNYRKGDAF